MSDGQFDPNSQELFALGKPIRNLIDLINTGLFQGGTLDIFHADRHLRVPNIHLVVKGEDITLDPRRKQPVIMQFRKGVWKPARNQTLDLHTYGSGASMAPHDSEGKLMFVSLGHPRTPKSPPVQLVFYRTGRAPSPNDLQVIAWIDDINPLIGGKDERSKRH